MTQVKAEYLWCRRRTRKSLGLLSVAAPLDASSFVSMTDAARSCGVFSNTTTAHLTFVEGYRLARDEEEYLGWFDRFLSALKAIRIALYVNPSVRITSLHTVPRSSDQGSRLIVANAALSSSSANDAAQKLRMDSRCILPQFSLHIAVGACSSKKVDDALALASRRLVGLTLSIDGSQLLVLAPSLDEKIVPGRTIGRLDDAEERAKRLETNMEKFGVAITAAQGSADKLNRALSNSAHSMFSWTVDGSGSGTIEVDDATKEEGIRTTTKTKVESKPSPNTTTVEDSTEGTGASKAAIVSSSDVSGAATTTSADSETQIALPKFYTDPLAGRVCYICHSTCWNTPYCCWKL